MNSYTAVLYLLTEAIALALADAAIDVSPWPPSSALALAVAADPAGASLRDGPGPAD